MGIPTDLQPWFLGVLAIGIAVGAIYIHVDGKKYRQPERPAPDDITAPHP